MSEIKKLWNSILLELNNKISTVSNDMWFSKLEPLTFHNDNLVIVAPLKNYKTVLNNNYKELLLEAITKQNSSITNFIIITPDEKHIYEQEPNTDNNMSDRYMNLDESFTFENFVIGGSNQIAFAAAHAVAKNPGVLHNPLFIYGGVGLGKTHIMHSIGNYIKKNKKDYNLLFVNTEQFVNDFIDSISNRKDNELNRKFREKYRNVDVLMLDDVQFLANKQTCQEALFHTFNELYQSKKQIILSSDRHPKELNFLEERLQSRFQCGLTVDITAPDIETRIAILMNMALSNKFNVSSSAIYFIAEQIDSNIRELKGAFTKVMFYCQLVGKACDNIEIVKLALKDEIEITNHSISMDTISDAVCSYFNVAKNELKGKKKQKNIALARQIAIYLINDLMGVPLATIGAYFGGKDHTTIMYSRDKINELEKTDNLIAKQIKDIRGIINKF